MKIAIASSGLGHISRGIEAWALSLALGLQRAGESAEACADIDVTLFAAALPPVPSHNSLSVEVLPCIKRNNRIARVFTRLAPPFTWRWGWRAPYALEQVSFAGLLVRRLRKYPVDIVHTQDVILAHCLQRAVVRGDIATRIILAHGTDEVAETLRGLPVIQHLTPMHQETLAPQLPSGTRHFVIPNFVDAAGFQPPTPDEHEGLRRAYGIPRDALVIGYSGALIRGRKRFHELIEEVARLAATGRRVFLLAAGAAERDTPACLDQARRRLPGMHHVCSDVPFAEMPQVYRAMDLYVHPAPEEFFGICLLEAMACGVPVVVNQTPVLKWITGDGGWVVDICAQGYLAELMQFQGFDGTRKEKAKAARARAENVFSRDAVLKDVIHMYRRVIGEAESGEHGA